MHTTNEDREQIAAWLAGHFQLTRQRHEIVRRRLERFEARKGRALVQS